MNEEITPKAVVAFLQCFCVGSKHGIRTKDLVACLTGGASTSTKERQLRKIIADLCDLGFPICSSPKSGYWWATSSEEIYQVCCLFHARAVSSLRRIGRLKRIAVPILEGQLSLPVGAGPTIPESTEEVNFSQPSQQLKVGIVVEIPEELHELAKKSIQFSELDINDFYAKAVRYFLFKEGVIDCENAIVD